MLLLMMALSLGAQAQNGYVYVNNQTPNTTGNTNQVNAYSVSATGALTAVAGSPYFTGGKGANVVCYGLTRIALGTANKTDFLYVANTGDQTISAFQINPANGTLTTVPGSPFASGLTLDSCQGISLAATPKASYLFASSNGKIQSFSIAPNGALALVSSTPNCCTPNAGMAITTAAKTTYLAVSSQTGVSMYTVDTTTGLLLPVSGSPFIKTGTGQLSALDFSCDGSLLYAGEATGTPTQADAWSVNATTGALTPVPGSPFKNSVGNNSNIVALTPDNSLLLESNQFSNSLTTWGVNLGTGVLSTPQKFGGTTAVHTPAGIAVDASGTYAMVADDAFGIAVFRINAGGTLQSLSDTAITRAGEIQDLVAYPAKSCSLGHFDLTASGTPNPVPAGSAIAYSVTITNNGLNPASAVVSAQLPNNTTSGGSAVIAASAGAARLSNVVTITTNQPHGFVPGIKATISGVKDSSFNGTFLITSTPTALTFTYAQTAPDASSGSGTATVPACSVTGTGNTCGGLALSRYATFPVMQPSEVQTIVFVTTTSSTTTAGTVLTGNISVSNKSVVDANPINNSIPVPVTVARPAADAFSNVSGTGTFGGNATLTATLKDKAATPNPIIGRSVTFIFGGNAYIGTTDGSGIATVTVPLGQTTGGTHSNAFTVNFNGDASFAAVGATGTLTVTPATLTITADNISMPYGGPAIVPPATSPVFPTLTYTVTGFVNGDTSAVLTGSASCTTTATLASTVGSYPITCTQGTLTAPSYYTLVFVNGSFTVTPVQLQVQGGSFTRAYGAADPTFSGTLSTINNVQVTDGITATWATAPATSGTSPVGTYSVVPTLADPNSKLSNYQVVISNGTLIITAAPLTVAANSVARLYGDPNPAFTGTITGLQNGEIINVAYSTTATPGSPVGPYPIVPTVSDPNNVLANYALTIVNGTLLVNPAPLNVVAADASRLYGDPNPAFTGAITGTKNGDNISATYASAADPTSAVGTYPIVPTLVDPTGKLGNYTVTSTNGTLTVNPAPLVIQANDATKNAGDPNPTFTGVISGIKNSDNITASYSSPADATSPAGTYPIVPSADPNPLLSNYSVTLINGTLTVQ